VALGEVAALRSGLIVSCQAEPDGPLDTPAVMAAFAVSVVRAGAMAILARTSAPSRQPSASPSSA
jgi:putative N-acetylmannosamine-6-phosphate epimerase